MYIVVLADTHMPRMAKKWPQPLNQHLEKADIIIHAGDWQTIDVYRELSQYAPIYGVTGNVDEPSLHEILKRNIVVQIDQVKIGVTHGDGKGLTTEKRALNQFKNEELDILIFGHSHIPLLRKSNDLIVFNPGSPTDKRRQKQFSFGIIETGNELSIKHIFFDSKR